MVLALLFGGCQQYHPEGILTPHPVSGSDAFEYVSGQFDQGGSIYVIRHRITGECFVYVVAGGGHSLGVSMQPISKEACAVKR